jgi:hypothetical protein
MLEENLQCQKLLKTKNAVRNDIPAMSQGDTADCAQT